MNNCIKRVGFRGLVLFLVVFAGLFFLSSLSAHAKQKKSPPEKIKVIMIGDRLVDVAYNLGVVPEAMVVRCFWPMCKKLQTAVQHLGCPRCVTVKKKTIVAETAKRLGVKRIIIEKNSEYCLYMPDVRPANVVPLLAGTDLIIQYVDFSDGLESAIRQTAELVGRRSAAEAVIDRYKKALSRAKAALSAKKGGKKVVIISGIYQQQTGKTFLRIEMPGGYSDRYLLEPLGCVNIGASLKRTNAKVSKGHFIIRKLGALIEADPDAIIITGDAFAVQKALFAQIKKNPALSQVQAVKNMAVFSLPFYSDSGVLEYPAILRKWTSALAD